MLQDCREPSARLCRRLNAMFGPDFTTFPIWVNCAIFVVGAVVVWISGTKLAKHADTISAKTALGPAFVGALLLGGATSLPEIATTITASLLGNASMAVNNLMGGIAMQVAVLAVMDFWLVRGALTFFAPKPVVLLGGVLLILQIALAIAAIAVGEIGAIYHVGFWSILLFITYLMSLYFMHRYEGRGSWIPAELPETADEQEAEDIEPQAGDAPPGWGLYLAFALNCLAVFAGGVAISLTGDALAVQTGLSGGFVGATFVAISTSLPEISTTAAAVRLGGYTMAVANILGTNTLSVALLLLNDLFYREGTIIDAVDRSTTFVAALGIIVTGIYLWGLLERRNHTILRMGVDSFLVLIAYGTGIVLLYFM